MTEIEQLRAALGASPDNTLLRKMLAQKLLAAERFGEAELEFKEALRRAGGEDADLKIGLAETFQRQGKTSLGLVLIEELTQSGAPPARAWLVYAKLLLQAKQTLEAKSAYDRALLVDRSLRDALLESEINLANQSAAPEPERLRAGGPDYQDGDGDIPDGDGIDIERPRIDFSDVGGMDALKEEIELKIIAPLKHPEMYKAYGMSIGGGILMYGPPGCGKTHLARATAGEVKANFISVGISDILGMYIGQSERNLHGIFQRARDLKPCVLFFDEVDALGANRTDMRQSAGRHLINQFLSELDGVEYSNGGVLILAATNAPWHLDPAFRRPGRLGNMIFVPPPDAAAREEILRLKLADKPQGTLDLKKLTKRTDRFSGADLESIVHRATETKLREAMRTGKPIPLATDDLVRALKTVKPTTNEWFQTAKNYALFANESGLYDDILKYLK